MEELASVVLARSGYRAVIEPDRWVPGSFTLVVDGTPQSHVNLENPAELFFEYIQRMGHVIDQVKQPGEPITAVHLGAGAFTLPRYIEATRPGSRQQVVELESDLVDFVRAHLPWSSRAQIRA
jgi:spermidine synthase